MITFAASVAGPANKEQGISKQDSAMLRFTPLGPLLVVCDGLGSRPKSGIGAQKACLAVLDTLICVEQEFNYYSLCETIFKKWINRIHPENADLSSTTCLLALVGKEGKSLIVQLGDGLVICRSRGKFINLTPERSGFSNQTFALSETFDFNEWLICECDLAMPGDGIILMTDGLSEDIDSDRYEELFDEIRFQTFKRKSRPMRRWMTQQLHEWPTPGHYDDKSIAAIFR